MLLSSYKDIRGASIHRAEASFSSIDAIRAPDSNIRSIDFVQDRKEKWYDIYAIQENGKTQELEIVTTRIK